MKFESLANRYWGRRAQTYNSARTKGKKWQDEQLAIDNLLGTLARGASILDIPVGTGRFIPLYAKHGLIATGMDISKDMLREAQGTLARSDVQMALQVADIRAIPVKDGAFDCVLCMRFLNWIDIASVESAFSELVRVSREDLLIGIRYYVPRSELQPFSRPRNFLRYVRQLISRVSPKGGLVFHEKDSVTRMFEQAAAKVVNSVCVEARSDGTDYYIYHLKKASH